MLVFLVAGAVLLLGGRFIARAVLGSSRDPMGATRILQVVGAALLIIALFIRPHRDETAAFPPSPDEVADTTR